MTVVGFCFFGFFFLSWQFFKFCFTVYSKSFFQRLFCLLIFKMMVLLLAIIFNSHKLIFKSLLILKRKELATLCKKRHLELFDLLFTVHKICNSIIVVMERNLPFTYICSFFFFYIYLFGYARFWLWHVGSSLPCVGSLVVACGM